MSSEKKDELGRAPRKASGRSTAPTPSPKKAQGVPPTSSRASALLPELIHNFSNGAVVDEATRGAWVASVRDKLIEQGPMTWAYARSGRAIVIGMYDDEGCIRIFEVWQGYRELSFSPAIGIRKAATKDGTHAQRGPHSDEASPKEQPATLWDRLGETFDHEDEK